MQVEGYIMGQWSPMLTFKLYVSRAQIMIATSLLSESITVERTEGRYDKGGSPGSPCLKGRTPRQVPLLGLLFALLLLLDRAGWLVMIPPRLETSFCFGATSLWALLI